MTASDADLLKGLGAPERNEILSLASVRRLSEGEVLFRLGEEARQIFLVEQGQVNLTLPIRLDGKQEDFLVEERREGQLLGWSGLVAPYRFTLQAKAPGAAELLALDRTDLLDLFSRRPEVGYLVLTNLARLVGQRLQVFQTMWLRGVQRGVAGTRS